MRNFTEKTKPYIATTGETIIAGSGSAGADKGGNVLDRFATVTNDTGDIKASFEEIQFLALLRSAVTATKTVTYELSVKTCDDTSGFGGNPAYPVKYVQANGTLTDTRAVLASVVHSTPGGNETLKELPILAKGLKRYVQFMIKPVFTNTGTDTATIGVIAIMGDSRNSAVNMSPTIITN